MNGKAIMFCAPSGAGKTTIVSGVKEVIGTIFFIATRLSGCGRYGEFQIADFLEKMPDNCRLAGA